ncbi:MAG: bifunctional DNA-formamidopyrimidine glycosylase/DNA-(apurinic or apyrimidinic site) lyase [Dehalococcoidales bacterium]|nr:bifunctional DNA-formamidopyrimidine glycosylase/DNA-(apurinic or apyrimidinic site) lyase [Dehalococcoidales bacterium]
MPELPEVETVKNEIAPHVLKKRIKEVVLLWDGIVRQPAADEFKSRLAGRKIKDVVRRGKYLLVHLSGADVLILHLKMTGSLLLDRSEDEPPKYTRAILHLDDGTAIFFRDPRKFGRMWLVQDIDTVIGKLGPEALSKDLTEKRFADLLSRRKTPSKALLCDQECIAGIGNLYADEALFLAKIHPLRSAASLDKEETVRLHKAVREVLLAGIKNKGASIVNYYRPDGSKGTAHSEFRVARRGKQPCFVCGTPIERIVVRGRGTYFCPNCQQLT